MFPAITFLKDNLTSESKAQAVREIKTCLDKFISQSDWKKATDFFNCFLNEFIGNTSILNIVSPEFSRLVDALFQQLPDFKTTFDLDFLSGLYWFDSLPDAQFKKGTIAENAADYGKGITEIIKLEDARKHYRHAKRTEDVLRIQQRLTTKVKNIKWNPAPTLSLNNPHIEAITKQTQVALEAWNQADNNKKYTLLVNDFTGIRPEHYSPEIDSSDDIMVSGMLEECGVIRRVGFSPSDGRITSQNRVSPKKRIHFEGHDTIIEHFLEGFVEPILQWLRSNDCEDKVYQCVGGAFKQHLNWDDRTTDYFMEGMAAWVSGVPQVGMSIWLPFFENVLRIQLASVGEDVINPQTRSGLEDFVLFDNLLKKAENHYPLRTVLYWRMLFSTHKGIGWNLRNSFCHGLLPLTVLKNDRYVLAVFLGYLYLMALEEKE